MDLSKVFDKINDKCTSGQNFILLCLSLLFSITFLLHFNIFYYFSVKSRCSKLYRHINYSLYYQSPWLYSEENLNITATLSLSWISEEIDEREQSLLFCHNINTPISEQCSDNFKHFTEGFFYTIACKWSTDVAVSTKQEKLRSSKKQGTKFVRRFCISYFWDLITTWICEQCRLRHPLLKYTIQDNGPVELISSALYFARSYICVWQFI